MRTFIITSWLFLVAPLLGYAAGGTNEFKLFTYRANGEKSEWRISTSRVLATPEWKPGTNSIPLSPDRALQIAREWCLKKGFVEPELTSLWIQPFPRTDVGSRFYYNINIHCRNPARSNSMSVVVLLDGTVLEPRSVPDDAQVDSSDDVKLSPVKLSPNSKP